MSYADIVERLVDRALFIKGSSQADEAITAEWLDAAAEEIKRLRLLIEEKNEALKPFAKAWTECFEKLANDDDEWLKERIAGNACIDDLRRARTAKEKQ